jgi:hypothetical protein
VAVLPSGLSLATLRIIIKKETVLTFKKGEYKTRGMRLDKKNGWITNTGELRKEAGDRKKETK